MQETKANIINNPLVPSVQENSVNVIGKTINEATKDVEWLKNVPFVTVLNGEPILRKDWDRVIREEDFIVFIRVYGRSDDPRGKGIGYIIVGALAAIATGGLFLGGAIGGLYALAGIIGAAGLIYAGITFLEYSPNTPEQGHGNAIPSPSQTPRFRGNYVRINEPIPVVYGRPRIWPDYLENPFVKSNAPPPEDLATGIKSEKRFIALLSLGQGQSEIQDIRVNELIIYKKTSTGIIIDGFIGTLGLGYWSLRVSEGKVGLINNPIFISNTNLTSRSITYDEPNNTDLPNIHFPFGVFDELAQYRQGQYSYATLPQNALVRYRHGNVIWRRVPIPGQLNPQGEQAYGSQYVYMPETITTLRRAANDTNKYAEAVSGDIAGPYTFRKVRDFTQIAVNLNFPIGHRAVSKQTGDRIGAPGNRAWIPLLGSIGVGQTGFLYGYRIVLIIRFKNDLGEYMKFSDVISVPINEPVYTILYQDRILDSEKSESWTNYFNLSDIEDVIANHIPTYPDMEVYVYCFSKTYNINEDEYVWQSQVKLESIRLIGEAETIGGQPITKKYDDLSLVSINLRLNESPFPATANKINLLVHRRLPQIIRDSNNDLVFSNDFNTLPDNGKTRNPVWAVMDILMNEKYGAKVPFSKIHKESFFQMAQLMDTRGDYFDGIFDRKVSIAEAIKSVAQVGRMTLLYEGGIFRLVRDQLQSVPVAMFTNQNIIAGSLNISYRMPSQERNDGIQIEYLDERTNLPRFVSQNHLGGRPSNPAEIKFFGITREDHARREALFLAKANHYRRKEISFSTELEGMIPSVGDAIIVSHDLPSWGHNGQVESVDSSIPSSPPLITLSEDISDVPDDPNSIDVIALRKRNGQMAGPFQVDIVGEQVAIQNSTVVSEGNNEITIRVGSEDVRIYYGGKEERTHFIFSRSAVVYQKCIVKSISISEYKAKILAIEEDDRVHQGT